MHHDTTAAPSGAPEQRKGKRRAVLAGGLVLGIGAAVTLAAWTDEVHVFGQFGTGDQLAQFQGNVGTDLETGWYDYHGNDILGEGQMNFGVTADGLTPTDTIYAPVSLRTIAKSVPFEVTVRGDEDPGSANPADIALYNLLRYRVNVVASPTDCNASGFAGGTPVSGLSDWSVLFSDSADDAIELGMSLSAGDPGPATTLCFAVAMDPTRADDLDATTPVQSGSLEIHWVFDGTAVPQVP